MLHRVEAPAGGRETLSGRTGGRTRDDAHIPLWRRITALLMLASLVILIAAVLAATFAATALLALFVLERAIAG
ncbi:MAG: hypothetical protein R2761_17395 [Acidimicrobiales bacterium]